MRRWLLMAGCVVASGVVACDDPLYGRARGRDRIEITLSPDTVAVGASARAVGQMWRDDGLIVRSSRDFVLYSSGNPAVATVNATTGAIVGVAPGRAEIFATWETRRAIDTITVVPARD